MVSSRKIITKPDKALLQHLIHIIQPKSNWKTSGFDHGIFVAEADGVKLAGNDLYSTPRVSIQDDIAGYKHQ